MSGLEETRQSRRYFCGGAVMTTKQYIIRSYFAALHTKGVRWSDKHRRGVVSTLYGQSLRAMS